MPESGGPEASTYFNVSVFLAPLLILQIVVIWGASYAFRPRDKTNECKEKQTQMKEANTWEYGDFQTPCVLARKAIAHLTRFDTEFQPKTIIEPTCGVGAFLCAAADAYPEAERVVGLEIESGYLNTLRSRLATREDADRFDLLEADFFKMDWENFLADLPEPFLITGNPPWVTSSDIGRLKGSNLPEKSNFQKYTGLESITGKANFDISESIMIRNLEWISEHDGCLAMLCKTAVARKVLRHAWKNA